VEASTANQTTSNGTVTVRERPGIVSNRIATIRKGLGIPLADELGFVANVLDRHASSGLDSTLAGTESRKIAL
jgi:hypothetical protein